MVRRVKTNLQVYVMGTMMSTGGVNPTTHRGLSSHLYTPVHTDTALVRIPRTGTNTEYPVTSEAE